MILYIEGEKDKVGYSEFTAAIVKVNIVSAIFWKVVLKY